MLKIEPTVHRDRYFYQYYHEIKNPNGNFRLLEYEIEDDSNEYDRFHLTDVEYTEDGVKRQHSKYCKLCQAGGPTREMVEGAEVPIVIHERTD